MPTFPCTISIRRGHLDKVVDCESPAFKHIFKHESSTYPVLDDRLSYIVFIAYYNLKHSSGKPSRAPSKCIVPSLIEIITEAYASISFQFHVCIEVLKKL